MSEIVTEMPPKISLGEQAYQRLKEDIVWCRLHPGEEVSENRLCDLYGMGKSPMRQALSRLAQEEYVVSHARRGHVIAPVTLKAVRELFDWRLVVEPAASERACGRVDRDLLLALDAQCVSGYTPGDTRSEARFVQANNAFHMAIARFSGNARIETAMRDILDQMTRLLHLAYVLRERPSELRSEHAELIEALAQNDQTAARRLTVAHIQSVHGMVMDGITQFSSLSEANIAPA